MFTGVGGISNIHRVPYRVTFGFRAGSGLGARNRYPSCTEVRLGEPAEAYAGTLRTRASLRASRN